MSTLTIVSVSLIIIIIINIPFYWNFIEVIVDLHAVVRNDIELPCILCPISSNSNILEKL